MIDIKVKKRDGNLEDFDIDKPNKWASWASETCNIPWSDVVLKASLKFYDGMPSEEIQKLLISECLSRRDTAHFKMAARLLVGVIYKEAYSDFSIPSLKDFYKEAVFNGWWKDMNFSDEELDELDAYIDHTKDLTYSYTTLKQFYDKYAVKTGCTHESPQMALMAVAMDLMGEEENRLEEIKEEYRFLSNLDMNLPTPSLNGLRTPLEGSPSCVLISSKDTTESIGAATHIAYEMTAARSGIGIEYETRAPKEPVKGGRVEHGGKHSIYSYLDKAVKAMSQVSRGGSATVTYTCLDPEISKLLTLKLQRTEESYRLDHLDYSFAVNNLFLKKAAKGDQWMCVSPLFAPKLHELFYSPDEEMFEEEYNKVLADTSIKHKIMVDARKVLLAWISARSDTGRNYITFINNVNQQTPFKDPIRLSNLCVAPDTLILTKNGHTPIIELDGKCVEVWNGFEWSTVTPVKTGQNQAMIKVVVEDVLNGELQSLECTPYHKWYDYKGAELRTFQLSAGDILLPWKDPSDNKEVIHRVVSLTETLNSDTYCFEEPKRNMGVFNGILTGQCQEVLLPTKGYNSIKDLYNKSNEYVDGETSLCFLASIVVKDRSDEEWQKLAYYTAKTIDNTIERSVYPFPQLEYTNKRRRNIGVGLTNLAHWMATKGYEYDTLEGRNAVHRLVEKHSYYLHKASIRLAKERGRCEWFNKTKYADGWLPIDSYKKAVDDHHSQELVYDWEEVRSDIKKYGMRFSVLESFMPVESSSLFTNSSNGLYPARRLQIIKQSKKGSVYFEVPDAEELGDKYQLAWDIDQLDMVKFYAIVQKFTGQGISADFYHDYSKHPKVVAKDVMHRVFLAARLGMKTMYYEVFNTEAVDPTKQTLVENVEEGCDSCTL